MQQSSTISQSTNEPQLPREANYVSQKQEKFKNIASTILIIIAAPLIALALTTFVFQSYEVDGPSMEKTLQDGDRLIVLKTGKTWSKVKNKMFFPKRGDVVVFEKHDSVSAFDETERQLIKRVLGLPGDRVVVREGKVTIYNSEHPEGFDPDKQHEFSDKISAVTPGEVDITVPQGEVFVAGDNRVNSLDSRSFGTIPTGDIIGTLSLRIYPFSKFEHF